MKKSQNNRHPMRAVVDPLLILQLLAAVLIVLTQPDSSEELETKEASMPRDCEPFQLSDGNTYVEHAGMAVEAHRIRSLKVA